MKFPSATLLASLVVFSLARADEPQLPPGCSLRRDIVYVTRDPGGPQKLDLYLPAGKGPHPFILRIHGGAWRGGDKAQNVPAYLLEDGYAIASVEHRFTKVAPFPAQIQDVKAALRFLREHAAEFDLDPRRAAALGDSSGAHLASLVGLTSGVAALTDDPDSRTSDRVLAVVDFYAPSDLRTIPGNWKTSRPDLIDAVNDLVGGPLEQHQDMAKAATLLTYVGKTSPPFLILQGDKDGVVAPAQSIDLDRALKAAGASSELVILPGAGHGGPEFSAPKQRAKIRAFLDKYLR